MDGIKKGYLRFGGPKGLPEDANYLNNTDTDNNTGSISEMTQEELIYNIVASYLLENAFAEDIDSANAMMESMSTVWVGTIIEEYNEYVEDYNEFVENLQIAGYDLTEATEEDIEEAYKDEDKKKKVERDAKKKKEESGYNPEKLNKDWYSRVTPDSKMKRKDGSMETVSQRMNREKPYVKRMTGRMGREYGSRTAANVTDVLRALQGNDPYRMKRR